VDSDFATRWRLIKTRFTQSLLENGYEEPARNMSRRNREEHTVWQRRFREHLIRDEMDWKCHLDYIHYNPVKHGHAQAPVDWPYSTFQKFVRLGEYERNWGGELPETLSGWQLPGGADD
jgi:putative transposase